MSNFKKVVAENFLYQKRRAKKTMDDDYKREFSIKIAGEIVLSKNPYKTIKKWREIFGVTQLELSKELGVSPSVVSDYESGRRKSPGANMIKRFVEALINIDEKRGSKVLRAYKRMHGSGVKNEAILDIREFSTPMKIKDFCSVVNGKFVANRHLKNKEIYGYTAIDSIRAILEMSSDEFIKIYGLTSERALVFTKVSSGRSPLVAIRVSSIKPGVVVLQGLKKVDPLGIKIAERERIPIIISRFEDPEELIKELRRRI